MFLVRIHDRASGSREFERECITMDYAHLPRSGHWPYGSQMAIRRFDHARRTGERRAFHTRSLQRSQPSRVFHLGIATQSWPGVGENLTELRRAVSEERTVNIAPSRAQAPPPILAEPPTPRSVFTDQASAQFRNKLSGHGTDVVNMKASRGRWS
jgi:hypothetical protein